MTFEVTLAITGIALAFIGIPLAVYFARRTPKRPRIGLAVSSELLLSPENQPSSGQVKIMYDGVPVTRISRSFVALWHDVGTAVTERNIVDTDPIRIEIPEGDQLLGARVLYQSRPQIELEVVPERSKALISFKFLDTRDGGVLELIHQESTPTVAGSLVDADIQTPDVRMTPETFEGMREPSWRKRLRAKWEDPERRTFGRIALIGIPGIILVVPLMINEFTRERPQLVDVERFNVDTLASQRAFASEVSRVGLQDTGLALVIVPLGLLVVSTIFGLMVLFARHSFPASIVRDEVSPAGPTSDPENGALQ